MLRYTRFRFHQKLPFSPYHLSAAAPSSYKPPSSSSSKMMTNGRKQQQTSPTSSPLLAETRDFYDNTMVTNNEEEEELLLSTNNTSDADNNNNNNNNLDLSLFASSSFQVTNPSSSTSQLAVEVRQSGLASMAEFYSKQGLLLPMSLSSSSTIDAINNNNNIFESVMQRPSSSLFKISRKHKLAHLTISSQLKKRFIMMSNTMTKNDDEKSVIDFPFVEEEEGKQQTNLENLVSKKNEINDIFVVNPVSSTELEKDSQREFLLQWLQRHVSHNAITTIDLSSIIIPTIVNNIVEKILLADDDNKHNKEKHNNNSSSTTTTKTTSIIDYCSFLKDKKLQQQLRRSSSSSSKSCYDCPTSIQNTFCDVLYDVVEQLQIITEKNKNNTRSASSLAHHHHHLSFKAVVPSEVSFDRRQQRDQYKFLYHQQGMMPEYEMIHHELVSKVKARKQQQQEQGHPHQKSTKEAIMMTNKVEVCIPELLVADDDGKNNCNNSNNNKILIMCPPSSQDCVRSFDSQTGAAVWAKKSDHLMSNVDSLNNKRKYSSSSPIFGSDALSIPVDYFPQLKLEFDEIFELQSRLLLEGILNSVIVESACASSSTSSTTTSTVSLNLVYGVPSCNPLEGEAVIGSVIQQLYDLSSSSSQNEEQGIAYRNCNITLTSMETLGDTAFMSNNDTNHNKRSDDHQEEEEEQQQIMINHNNSSSSATTFDQFSSAACESWYVPREFFQKENYQRASPEFINESIRQMVAGSSIRFLPWSSLSSGGGNNNSNKLGQYFDGSYFCTLKLGFKVKTTSTTTMNRNEKSLQKDDDDVRNDYHGRNRNRRGGSNRRSNNGYTNRSSIMKRGNQQNDEDIIERNRFNSIRTNMNSDDDDELSSTLSSSSPTPTLLISIKTLYALLLKKNVSKNEIQHAIEETEKKMLNTKMLNNNKADLVNKNDDNDNDDEEAVMMDMFNLSTQVELDSWRSIDDLLVASSSSSKSHYSENNNKTAEQDNTSGNNNNSLLGMKTVGKYQFKIAVNNDDDNSNESSSSSLSTLLEGCSEISLTFDLIEQQQRESSSSSSLLFLSIKEDEQTDFENVAQSKDSIGYVLKCLGVEAVGSCGKDWMKFIMKC